MHSTSFPWHYHPGRDALPSLLPLEIDLKEHLGGFAGLQACRLFSVQIELSSAHLQGTGLGSSFKNQSYLFATGPLQGHSQYEP